MKVIQVDAGTIRLGLLVGLMLVADDGVFELTERGDAWLREWCEAAIARQKAAA